MLTVVLTSCKSDEETTINDCPVKGIELVAYAFTPYDSIRYKYSDSQILEKIEYKNASRVYYYDTIQYNSKGQISKVSNFYLDPDDDKVTLQKQYTFSYDSKNLAKSVDIVVPQGLNMTWSYIHDEKSRLTEITLEHNSLGIIVANSVRYEYNTDGNVVKVFYKVINGGNTSELLLKDTLAIENLSFDQKPTFYTSSKQLQFVNTYLYRYLPNKNNVLKSKNYYFSPTTSYSEPQTFEYSVSYNNRGYIKSSRSTSTSIPIIENYIEGISYYCD